MRSVGSLALLLFMALAGVASAASQQDRDDCKQDKDHDRRIAGCTRVVQDQGESASDRAVAYRSRGVAYDMIGATDRAVADFDQAIKLDPNFALAWFSRGRIYSTKREYDRAITQYNEAIRLDPTYANALGNRGIAYAEKGDHERAIADYNAALRIRPHPIDFTNRGVSYFKKADYDRAIADFGQAIKIDPKSVLAFSNRGAAYENKRDYDRAIADYDRALKLDPNSSHARTGRDRAQQAKRAAAPPPATQQPKQRGPEHYLLNSTPIQFDVIDNGRTVCSLAPRQSCWWPATPGQHAIELRRQDGRSIRMSLSTSGSSGILHQVVCPKDFGTSERSDAPVCN